MRRRRERGLFKKIIRQGGREEARNLPRKKKMATTLAPTNCAWLVSHMFYGALLLVGLSLFTVQIEARAATTTFSKIARETTPENTKPEAVQVPAPPVNEEFVAFEQNYGLYKKKTENGGGGGVDLGAEEEVEDEDEEVEEEFKPNSKPTGAQVSDPFDHYRQHFDPLGMSHTSKPVNRYLPGMQLDKSHPNYQYVAAQKAQPSPNSFGTAQEGASQKKHMFDTIAEYEAYSKAQSTYNDP